VHADPIQGIDPSGEFGSFGSLAGAALANGIAGGVIGGGVGGVYAAFTGGNIARGIGIGATSGFVGGALLPFASGAASAAFAGLGLSAGAAASAGLFAGGIFAGAASGGLDAWLRGDDPVIGALVGGFAGVIGSAVAKAVGPGLNVVAQRAPELSDDVIRNLAGKEVLVLGRVQSFVDEIADELSAAGVRSYTVSDPSRKLLIMKVVEDWATRNPNAFRSAIRDLANYVSDAAHIANSKYVLQNSWDWTSSGYTILEHLHVGFWSSVRRLGSRIGPEEIIRFFRQP
jgi:hypothetical protein